ncbi:MAG: DUF4097 family beta strand repeat-containing protein [Terriglobia bacterium]|jgi:DUF4097 and DUF4098 domain-containing protein YvlB
MKKLSIMMLAALVALAIVIPAAARSRIEKTLKLEPNGRFAVDSDVGSVTITGKSSSGAHVVIEADREDFENRYTINFEENSGFASVTVRRKDRFSWNEHGSVHFEIEVPSQTQTDVRTGGSSVTVSNLRGESALKTSGGSIDVSGLNGKLDARTSGGSIHLREVSGDTRADTSGGGIEVDSLDGSLTAHTSGGSIHIDRVTGYVEAKTSGGPIRVNFGRGNARGGVLETSGGSIEALLDHASNLDIDASTSGGSVESDLPVRVVGKISASSLHGSLGSGGETLRLHTSGGSIHIKSL